MRGEQIGAEGQKRTAGRPKMTEEEKEAAREKRRNKVTTNDQQISNDEGNSATNTITKAEDQRLQKPAETSSAAVATSEKRKYNKEAKNAEKPVYQSVVNDKGASIGKKD